MLRSPNASLRDSVHYGGGHISMLFVLSAVAVSFLITDRNRMPSRQWEATQPAAPAASEQSDAADRIAADVGSRDPTTEAMLLQIQACCLPPGICFELDYMPCVLAGGDPQGPGTSCFTLPEACSPLKWSQPPTFSPTSPEPNCFWGWDELSHYDCCQIVADDFLCITPEPITNVHWWGSYRGWLGQAPPADAPPAFHIGIWTDVPVGAPSDETCCYCWNPPGVPPPTTCSPNPPDQATCDMWGGGQYQQCTYMPNSRCVIDACEPQSPLPYSHPGTMIHQWVVTREMLRERPVGCDFHPEFPPGDTCFKYDFEVLEADWFYQPASPIENIYWVSISAMYGPRCACNGDVNGDGQINAADIASLLACIGLPPNPPCDRADINCDGVINAADIAALNCLMAGGLNCCPGTTPPPVFPWGWKTREHFFQDDAVVILDPHAPVPASTFIEGYPIERPPGLSWDMSFTLTTQRPEACCINDLAGPFCTNVLPSQCTPQGIPQGPGTACSGTTIACCLPNGTCEDVDPLCCDDLGGTPSGSAVACMGDLNGNGVDDACEVPCEPMPDGSQCRPTICPNILDTCVPTRVYCPPTGGPCTVITCDCRPGQFCHVDLDLQQQPVCVAGCQQFEVCEPVILGLSETECHCAPIPLEACCFVDGSCQMLTPDHCLSIDGTPQGLGSSCSMMPQACCLPNGSCANVDPLCCDEMGGTPPTSSMSCLTDLSGNGVDDACETLDHVVCEPQGPNAFHPPIYWYDVTPTGFGRCDFHVRVYDPNPANYTNWNITPWPGNTWQFLVHQVGAEWWASWWDSDSGCPNAFFVPTRFEFTNSSPNTWGDWTTTISNASDPYLQVVDRTSNHPGESDGFGRRVHVPMEQAPVQACCRSDGTCVLTTHMDCVTQGGDPMGPGTDCDTVVCAEIKWSQPPVFNPFSPHPECFYGWDEISIHGLWQIVADDWLCTTEQPITDIHWWGSYMGWSGVQPPPPPYLTPTAFHIGIWTDFPGGIFSHPDVMIWEWIVPRSALNERPVACNFHPEHNFPEPDGCFRYDYQIPPNQWFHQGPVDAIYWISISAMYDEVPCACNGDVNGDGLINLSDVLWLVNCINGAPIDCSRADVNCDGQLGQPDVNALQCLLQGLPHDQCCPPFTPVYAWGWKTRLPSWNDDAVRITEPTAPRTGIPPMPPFPMYLAGTPIENQEGSWDMSFVMTTQPTPCVTDGDCVRMDANVCTCDQCVDGVCVHTPIEFGNVDCSDNQQPNLDDILCVLLGFGGFDNCPNGDIHPYCTGNDVINLDDILAVLAAFGGFDPCNCQP